MCCKNRGHNSGKPYPYCETRLITEQCDSLLDLVDFVHEGCTICSDPSSPFMNDPSCELMETNPDACATIIKGIEFDVDSDGDGENDSWSALFGFETQRVRIYDVEQQ